MRKHLEVFAIGLAVMAVVIPVVFGFIWICIAYPWVVLLPGYAGLAYVFGLIITDYRGNR